ncbi:hypothetical protein [Austwickia chelonae]|nr:hypothetical protein [Austwickia chelonae]
MADAQMDACEAWIRARGLPQVLTRRSRSRALLRRVSALLSAMTVINVLWLLAASVVDGVQETEDGLVREEDEVAFILSGFLVLGGPILALPVGLGIGWLLRALPNSGSKLLAVIIGLIHLLLPPVMGKEIDGDSFFISLLWQFSLLVILLFLTYIGVGNVLVWSLKRSVSQATALGAMIARVLPVFLVVVLFFFFNAEIWQVAAGIDYGRTFGVGMVLLVLALLVVVVTALDEMHTMFHKHESRNEAEFSYAESVENEQRMRSLLRGTPFASVSMPRLRPPLRVSERVNLQLVAIAAQVIQVFLFTMLMGVFFTFFGQMAITDAVAKTWISSVPEPMMVAGFKLPFSSVHFKVSFLLACFSGLSFAASSNSDETYRKSFLDPVLAENEVNLAIRDAYQGLLAEQELYGEPGDDRSELV